MKAKKTIFFEMVLRKNGIWLTVNGVWAPPTWGMGSQKPAKYSREWRKVWKLAQWIPGLPVVPDVFL